MTIFAESKKDVLDQNYANAQTLQLAPLTTAEIAARVPDDKNGTLYHDATLFTLHVKLNGVLRQIQTL